MRKKVIVFSLLLLAAANIYSQTFTQISTDITDNSEDYSTPVMTVLNGDNKLDLLVGWNRNVTYFKQSSVGGETFHEYSVIVNYDIEGDYASPVVVDLDGDGLLDLVVGGFDGKLKHYEQNSEWSTSFSLQTPNFLQDESGTIDVGVESSPVFCDLDGDGLLDLLVGKNTGKIYHYEQSAPNSTTFIYRTNHFNNIDLNGNYNHSVPAIMDLDNDDKLDILVGWLYGTISRWEQDAINSTSFSLVEHNFNSIDVGSVACLPGISDFDNDGYLDLMIGSENDRIEYWESDLQTVNYDCVETTTASSITENSASVGGNVTDNNCHIVYKRGICYSSSETEPDLTDIKTLVGQGTGVFSTTISGLSRYTTYYYRAFALSELGIFYAPADSFTTTGNAPTVTTTEISNITSSSASSGGNITDNGGPEVTERGVCWSTSQNPTISDSHTSDGTGTGSFISEITGLNPATIYYVRAYAVNSIGTGYGEERSFTTSPDIPTVTTSEIINISLDSAEGGGNVTQDNGAAVTARGVCWSTNSNPSLLDNHTIDGSGTGAFTSNISGLQEDTRYYVRAYATNSVGTNYGNEVEFNTPIDIINMLDFDGTDQYITSNITLPNSGTIEFWINLDNTAESSTIFDVGSAMSNWYLNFSSNDGYYVKIGSNSAIHQSYTTENKWHHIAVTWNKRYSFVDFSLYIDGYLKDTIIGNIWSSPVSSLIIGSNYLLNNAFNGQMDEFRIWNFVLTPTQILENMHNIVDPSSSGLLCNYRFDQSGGSAATDDSGNGYDAVLYNMTNSNWQTSTAPIGEYGAAVRSNSQTSAGISGTQIKATITNPDPVNNNNYIGIYTSGDGSEMIESETFPPSVIERFGITWGMEEVGDCDVNLVFEYDGVSGITNENELKLLRRDNRISAWTDITYLTNRVNQSFTLSYAPSASSEFSLARGIILDTIIGNALELDGADDYVNVGNDESLNFGNILTIECWVKPNDLSGRQGIFSTRLDNESGSFQVEIGPGSNGSNRVAVAGVNTWVAQTEDDVIAADEWFHIAYTRSGIMPEDQKLYINGEEQSLITNVSYEFLNNSSDKVIASGTNGGQLFNGIIDEMRVWNIARSKTEIRENMYLPLYGGESDLVSYWQFNEDSGTNVDEVISGNDGTLNNMDEEDWIDSTIPFGDGISDSQTETAGTVDFTDTGLSMYFNSHNSAEITVTRINATANINPTEPDEVFDAQYWVVNRYGNGTFDTDLTFTISEDLTSEDEGNPSQIKLYTRSSNADSNWILLMTASSVNASTDEVTFDNITDFSQFFIGRTAPQSLNPPQNLTIEVVDEEVQLSWDEVVGANSYKIYASDDPYAADWEEEIGSVAETSWTTDITGLEKKFYRVVSSTESVTRDSDLKKKTLKKSRSKISRN